MDILQRFIHIDVEEIQKDDVKVGKEETIIFPRYHQLNVFASSLMLRGRTGG